MQFFSYYSIPLLGKLQQARIMKYFIANGYTLHKGKENIPITAETKIPGSAEFAIVRYLTKEVIFSIYQAIPSLKNDVFVTTSFRNYSNQQVASNLNNPITAYKAVVLEEGFKGYRTTYTTIIAKILIPAYTPRNITNHKCRAARATVLSYETVDGRPITYNADNMRIFSLWKRTFYYPQVGVMVESLGYDGKTWFDTTDATCTAGIHFFLTRQEARNFAR